MAKHIKHILLIFSFLAFTIVVNAQGSFIPKALSEKINSQYPEINPILTPDGKTLYFSRCNHPENNYGKDDSQDIWYSDLQENGEWSEAIRLPENVNAGRYNGVIGIVEGGQSLLISGQFNHSGHWYKRGISIVHKTGTGWTDPEKIKVPSLSQMNKGLFTSIYSDNQQKVLLISMSRILNGKNNKLFVSIKSLSGRYSVPKKIKGEGFNKFKRMEAPFLSEDGKTLFFAGKNKETQGKSDIFVSTRQDDTYLEWSTPQRLSDTVNFNDWESYYRTNTKGSWAYFSSYKGKEGTPDIYKVKVFEENPFVVIKGQVINKTRNKPLDQRNKFVITSNDVVVDTVKINPDSASFRFKLPLRGNYNIKAVVKNYTSVPENIDVRGVREYTEVTKNLLVEPKDFTLLTGQLKIHYSNFIIPDSAKPKIIMDGKVLDSTQVTIKYPEGTYSLLLKNGKKHSLSVQAINYNLVVEKLDLTKIDEYQEIEKDLYADKIVEKPKPVELPKPILIAIVTGKVIDKKTNKPLSSKVEYEIHVNQKAHDKVKIDKENSTYEAELDFDTIYTVNAKASGYYPVFEQFDFRKEKTSIKMVKDLALAPIEVGQTVRLNNVFFETGKAKLKPTSYPELNRVADFLLEHPTIKLEIGGHTDNVGKPDKNLQLSRWRARACELYIETRGIQKDRITFQGYGMTKPVASNKTKEGKSQNRRVEFKILEK